jgi:hypothetical protein
MSCGFVIIGQVVKFERDLSIKVYCFSCGENELLADALEALEPEDCICEDCIGSF